MPIAELKQHILLLLIVYWMESIVCCWLGRIAPAANTFFGLCLSTANWYLFCPFGWSGLVWHALCLADRWPLHGCWPSIASTVIWPEVAAHALCVAAMHSGHLLPSLPHNSALWLTCTHTHTHTLRHQVGIAVVTHSPFGHSIQHSVLMPVPCLALRCHCNGSVHFPSSLRYSMCNFRCPTYCFNSRL